MSLQNPSRSDVWKMFNSISSRYDLINCVLSFGIDRYWRAQMAKHLPQTQEIELLDCATGTGDQIISLMQRSKNIKKAVGIDIAAKMLEVGRKKISTKPYKEQVELQEASAMALPFATGSFDCVTMSFGIRNVEDVLCTLKEQHRVLKTQGHLLILEFSLPTNSSIRALHLFYLRKVLPKMGGLLSKNKEAYRYLNATIETFPSGQNFCQLLVDAGFKEARYLPLSCGIATLYLGVK